jgi:acid phosphatase class B
MQKYLVTLKAGSFCTNKIKFIMKRSQKIINLFKIAQNKPTIVSFDFDDTLMNSFGGPIDKNISKLMGHVRTGDTVMIVTSRKDTEENRLEINTFLKQNGVDGMISNIYLVGGIKQPYLSELGVNIHYDDKEVELSALNGTGIIGIPA